MTEASFSLPPINWICLIRRATEREWDKKAKINNLLYIEGLTLT